MGFIDEFLTAEDKEFKHLLTIYPSMIEDTLCKGADQEFEIRYLLNEAKKKVKRGKFALQQKEYHVTRSFWNKFFKEQTDNPNKKKPTQDEVKRKVLSHSSYVDEASALMDDEDLTDDLRVKLDSLLSRNELLKTLASYKAKI